MDPNLSNGYEFNATVTYTIDTLNQYIYLGVLETINDYYTVSADTFVTRRGWLLTHWIACNVPVVCPEGLDLYPTKCRRKVVHIRKLLLLHFVEMHHLHTL